MAAQDGNQIMAEIIDKVDKILFKHGFEFDEESHTWEEGVQQLSAWVFQFYNDFGGEGEYVPEEVSTSSSEYDEMEESTTITDGEAVEDLNE